MSVTSSTTHDASVEVHRSSEHVRLDDATVRKRERVKRRGGVSPPALRAANQLFAVLPPLLVAVMVIASWYVSAAFAMVNPLFLPAPADVLIAFSDGIASGVYLTSTLVTVQESILGFLLALAIALPLGYGLVKSRLLAAAIHPYLAAGQAIPAIVIAPVLVLWLGYGLAPNTIVCMLVVFFPIVMNTMLGLLTIDQALTDAARVEGASGWSLLAHIEFPLALPAILTGVRTGFTLSITGALVAEFVQGGDLGLGALLQIAKNQYNMPFMFATLVVLAGLAVLYYGLTWLLARWAEAVY